MRQRSWLIGAGILGISFVSGGLFAQEEPKEPAAEVVGETSAEDQPWLKLIPVPADPELEEQIQEIQGALESIHKQMVRRKELLNTTLDSTAKATLYSELDMLRKERDDLEGLLHDLVEEAKLSERTAIDEALARARWLERQQESWEKKEELIRDRQE